MSEVINEKNAMEICMIEGAKFTVNLPITESYEEFKKKYSYDPLKLGTKLLDEISSPHRYRVEGMYKLTFEDGQFYVGGTRNIVSLIHNVCTLNDVINPNKLSLRQTRMKLAIDNGETIVFKILDAEIEDKYKIVKEYIGQEGCLNMKASNM